MEACRRDDVDPDWFHPHDSDTYTTELAKKICRGCPLREPCRDYALTTPENQGVWGGMSAKEREAFKKKMRRDALKGTRPNPVAAQRTSATTGTNRGTIETAPGRRANDGGSEGLAQPNPTRKDVPLMMPDGAR